MLNRKRHDLITSALADANQRHGFTRFQAIADQANDLTLERAEAVGPRFKYTRNFLILLDRMLCEADQPKPRGRRANTQKG